MKLFHSDSADKLFVHQKCRKAAKCDSLKWSLFFLWSWCEKYWRGYRLETSMEGCSSSFSRLSIEVSHMLVLFCCTKGEFCFGNSLKRKGKTKNNMNVSFSCSVFLHLLKSFPQMAQQFVKTNLVKNDFVG